MARNALALATLLLSAVCASGQGPFRKEFGSIAVTLVDLPKASPTHGYSEYRFRVQNTSEQNAHAVTLVLPKEAYPDRIDHIRRIARTVHVGPGETVAVSLLQPFGPPVTGFGIGVEVDGKEQEGGFQAALSGNQEMTHLWGSGYYYLRGFRGSGMGLGPLVLVSPGVPKAFEKPFQVVAPRPGGPEVRLGAESFPERPARRSWSSPGPARPG